MFNSTIFNFSAQGGPSQIIISGKGTISEMYINHKWPVITSTNALGELMS